MISFGDEVEKLTANAFVEGTSNLKTKDAVLIIFYVNWCSYCVALAPIIKQLGERVKFARIAALNIESPENKQLATILKESNLVNSFPTIIFYANQKPQDIYQGVRDIKNMIEYLIRQGMTVKSFLTDRK